MMSHVKFSHTAGFRGGIYASGTIGNGARRAA
jgi:hypothetical protein